MDGDVRREVAASLERSWVPRPGSARVHKGEAVIVQPVSGGPSYGGAVVCTSGRDIRKMVEAAG